MKIPLFLTLAGVLALSIGFATPAKAQLKIGTVDVQKVFNAYYKTKDANDKLKEAEKAYKDELDSRMDSYKKTFDTINKLNDEINKPDLSGAAKDQKSQERDSKINEAKGLEKEIGEFRQSREKQLQDQFRRMRDGIVEEIMRVVNDQVKAQNYDIVFDRSGASANNLVNVLLYARDSYDFSDPVITKLNANRPPPAAAATPSAVEKEKKPAATSTNTPATTTKPAGNFNPRKP
jgi:outer membrane protein